MGKQFQKIKTEQLESISSGDKSFEKELVEIFLEQIPSFISNMKLFLAENKLANLAKEAHTAKSSALIFGLTTTGDTLKKIQLLAENGKNENLSELLTIVEAELDNAANQLQELLSHNYQ